jgi:hypothetical protein
MNALANKPKWYASNLRWYLVVAFVPAMLGLVVAAYWGTQEWMASNSNQAQIAQWSREGIPYNNASQKEWYTKRTHDEGTADWTKVLELCTWGTGSKSTTVLPYLGSDGEELTPLVPGSAWPEEKLVGEYLTEMEPVMLLIERACKHPTPVRFQLAFDGFGTNLEFMQNSRSVMRLLNLDFDYAYHQRDTKRAMRDLQLMEVTIKAFDSRETMVSELVQIALRGIRVGCIRRSLAKSIWSDEELETLRVSISERQELSARWKDVMEGERAFALSGIESIQSTAFSNPAGEGFDITLNPLTPSGKKTLMEFYSRASALPNTDLKGLSIWSENLSEETQRASRGLAGTWVALVMPSFNSAITAEIYEEEHRRWTLTALATCQFKSKHEKWPARLRDLEELGLKVEDYSISNRELFGYQVIDETAYLWTRGTSSLLGGNPISPTIPGVHNEPDADPYSAAGTYFLYHVIGMR